MKIKVMSVCKIDNVNMENGKVSYTSLVLRINVGDMKIAILTCDINKDFLILSSDKECFVSWNELYNTEKLVLSTFNKKRKDFKSLDEIVVFFKDRKEFIIKNNCLILKTKDAKPPLF